jgi:hypothetical protein
MVSLCQSLRKVEILVSVEELSIKDVPLGKVHSKCDFGTYGSYTWAHTSRLVRTAVEKACDSAASDAGKRYVERADECVSNAFLTPVFPGSRAAQVKLSRFVGLETKLRRDIIPILFAEVMKGVSDRQDILLAALNRGYRKAFDSETFATIQTAFTGCLLEEVAIALSPAGFKKALTSKLLEAPLSNFQLKEDEWHSEKRDEFDATRGRLLDAKKTIEELDAAYRERAALVG